MQYHRQVKHVLWLALILNVFVAMAKTVYGFWTSTLSMVADGIHSFADAASSVMGLISVQYASKPSDRDHNYGHHKFETLAALGIGGMIALTSWEVSKRAVYRLIHPSSSVFHYAGLAILLVTMLINLAISSYERKKGRQYHSTILQADAYHTASDFWVSSSVLLSLIAIRFHIHWVDPVVSFLIAGYFGYAAFKLVRETGLVLTDTAFVDIEEIRNLTKTVPGVLSCHNIRTRGRAGYTFVDLHIQVDSTMDAITSHEVVHAVEAILRKQIRGITDVLIHTEPFPDKTDPDVPSGKLTSRSFKTR